MKDPQDRSSYSEGTIKIQDSKVFKGVIQVFHLRIKVCFRFYDYIQSLCVPFYLSMLDSWDFYMFRIKFLTSGIRVL